MRIVIDMQGAQSTGSRARGIGNYTQSFANAIIRNAGGHEIVLVLSDRFPETIEPLIKKFQEYLPARCIRIWNGGGGPASFLASSSAERVAGELSREAFVASLDPDIVILSSLFEGLVDGAASSIAGLPCGFPTAVLHYDLIPYIFRVDYLADQDVETWYEQKLNYLRRADLLLSISEASRIDAIDLLGFKELEVINISSAVDDIFFRTKVSDNTVRALRS